MSDTGSERNITKFNNKKQNTFVCCKMNTVKRHGGSCQNYSALIRGLGYSGTEEIMENNNCLNGISKFESIIMGVRILNKSNKESVYQICGEREKEKYRLAQ